jgi:hypothetical protein
MTTPLESMSAAVKRQFFILRLGSMEEVERLLESPLEETVFWTLCALFRDCYAGRRSTFGAPGAKSPDGLGVGLTARSDHWAELWPQLQVAAGGREYRIDLAMWIRHGRNSVAVAVELDGHDFHERTKEQAEADKRRDRDLQAIGWRVVRFTGSQVLRDPVEVVDEILGFAATVTKAAG